MNAKLSSLIAWSIMLIPLWWFLGVGSVAFHITAIIALCLLIANKGAQHLALPAETLFLGAFIAVYGISVLLNIKDMPYVRLLGTLYNLSFWIMGFIMLVAFNNSGAGEREAIRILRAIAMFGTLCGVIAAMGMCLWMMGYPQAALASPLARFIPPHMLDNLFGGSLYLSIVTTDYVKFGSSPRTSAFFPYPTALGMGMIITITSTLCYIRSTGRRFTAGIIAALALQVLALLLSLSRIAIIGILAAHTLVYIIDSRKTLRYVRNCLIGALIILSAIMTLQVFHISIVSSFNSFRQGSSNKRFYMYKTSFLETLKQPLWGYGYKPKPKELGVPLASHSTPISIFYKTGVFGIATLTAFWFAFFTRWYKSLQDGTAAHEIIRNLGVIIIAGMIWQITEDIDAPVIVFYLYFVVIGLIISLQRNPGHIPSLRSRQ